MRETRCTRHVDYRYKTTTIRRRRRHDGLGRFAQRAEVVARRLRGGVTGKVTNYNTRIYYASLHAAPFADELECRLAGWRPCEYVEKRGYVRFQYLGTRARMNGPGLVNCAAS